MSHRVYIQIPLLYFNLGIVFYQVGSYCFFYDDRILFILCFHYLYHLDLSYILNRWDADFVGISLIP